MRYRTGLSVKDIFPKPEDGTCAFRCGTLLMGRQQMWCSKKCTRSAVTEFKVQKGDVKTIRKLLLKRDKAICAHCAERDDKWQADHKTAVVNGGGGCAIDGFQTLCLECHKKKTKLDIAESKGRLPLIS